MTLSHPIDDFDDFGVAPSRVLDADPRVSDRWAAELEAANRKRGGERPALKMPSPIDALPELMRRRALPSMPWPAGWTDFARRCRTLPGDIVGVVADTGAGKTQWAIQAARAFAAAAAGAVLWLPLELEAPDLDLRIAANLAATHSMEVRDRWTRERIASALATVTDRWRFVDVHRGRAEVQLEVIDAAIEIATKIYGAPPLLVVDYVQLMINGADMRSALTEAMQGLTDIVKKRDAFAIALSQTSRGNSPKLAGRVESESASDTLGAAAEAAIVERASANRVDLVVFKTDDSPVLDAHWHIGKCRNTGLEGKVGARYHKAGGVWEELDHLPATPLEVAAEVKKSKRRPAGEGGPVEPKQARSTLNAGRADAAASARREAVVSALRAAGAGGMGLRDLRRVRGSGSAKRLNDTLAELARGGRVQSIGGRWHWRQ